MVSAAKKARTKPPRSRPQSTSALSHPAVEESSSELLVGAVHVDEDAAVRFHIFSV